MGIIHKKRLLSAVQPTKQLTLGNYIGAIRNWVGLEQDYECFFGVMDLHAMTSQFSPQTLHDRTLYCFASYLASGLSSEKSVIFLQSHIAAHTELAWVLACHSNMGELLRMTQYKDKKQRFKKQVSSGLFIYPLLMAADILLYDIDLVPVGSDQKQHLELARNLALRFNHLYQQDFFKIPEPYINKLGSRIMDLQDPTIKMSKSRMSESGVVFIDDEDTQIAKKIRKATTDSEGKIDYNPKNKPGISNLIMIQAVLRRNTIEEVISVYQDKQYGHLKEDTIALVLEVIRPIRDKISRYLEDKGELKRILDKGTARALEFSQQKRDDLYRLLRFLS